MAYYKQILGFHSFMLPPYFLTKFLCISSVILRFSLNFIRTRIFFYYFYPRKGAKDLTEHISKPLSELNQVQEPIHFCLFLYYESPNSRRSIYSLFIQKCSSKLYEKRVGSKLFNTSKKVRS